MHSTSSNVIVAILGMLFLVNSMGCRPIQSSPADSALDGNAPSAVTSKIDWSRNNDLLQAPDAVYPCEIGSCASSPDYELALEKEYWRNVQTDNFVKMRAWLDKSSKYIVYSSDRENRPMQMARLRKLNAFGNTMMYTLYDLHPIVPNLRAIKPQTSIADFQNQLSQVLGSKSATGVLYLLTGISQAMNSLKTRPGDQLAETFLLSVGGFAQAAMAPFEGLTGRKAFENTMIGPSCDGFDMKDPALKNAVCKNKGLIGPSWDSHKSCKDPESCAQVGTGTEGFTAAAMAMTLFQDHKMVQRGLTILGDGPGEDQVALCDTFLCTYNNPNNPQAQNTDATSIAPFKRLGVMLAIAEGYGKLGKMDKMRRVLREARTHGEKVGWPRMALLDKVEISLSGGDTKAGIPDLIAAWKKPNIQKDIAGEIQFPMPVSTKQGACSGCHYGGVMSRTVSY